jgi:glycine amidinotransferase
MDGSVTESRNTAPEITCPVNSFNEWDPLEEVIVGRLEGATIPVRHPVVSFNLPKSAALAFGLVGGLKYPSFLVKPAQKELDELIGILEAEGITVRRPDIIDFGRSFRSPWWKSKGFCIACPRDGFLVFGDEIIETPMAWRSRFHETDAYRSLFKEYFSEGARWTAAPKPQLLDELYDNDYTMPEPGEPMRYVVNEFEPVFDAADFIRCGREVFVTRSNVTNMSGITWLRRHLGEDYRVVEIESRCRQPMHIDSSFMPLAPGKVLINPQYIDKDRLPTMFKSWEILVAPEPDPLPNKFLSMCSDWISMNMLMLDEKRVIVEKSQPSMIRSLKEWGFEPIPCAFAHYAPFGGSFHCATLDVRRRGSLETYF